MKNIFFGCLFWLFVLTGYANSSEEGLALCYPTVADMNVKTIDRIGFPYVMTKNMANSDAQALVDRNRFDGDAAGKIVAKERGVDQIVSDHGYTVSIGYWIATGTGELSDYVKNSLVNLYILYDKNIVKREDGKTYGNSVQKLGMSGRTNRCIVLKEMPVCAFDENNYLPCS